VTASVGTVHLQSPVTLSETKWSRRVYAAKATKSEKRLGLPFGMQGSFVLRGVYH
jgi:hypothetical protein